MKNHISELKKDFYAKGGVKDTWIMTATLWSGIILLQGGYRIATRTVQGAINGGLQGSGDGFITGCQEAVNVIPEHIRSTWEVISQIPRNCVTMPRDAVRFGMMAAREIKSVAQYSYQHVQAARQRSSLISEIKSLPIHACQEQGQKLFLLLIASETKPGVPNDIAGIIVMYAMSIPINEKLFNIVVRNFSGKNPQFFLPPSSTMPADYKKKDDKNDCTIQNNNFI